MSVFVTRRIPEAGIEVLRAAGVGFEMGGEEGATPSREELLDGARRHPVILSTLTESVDAEVIDAHPGRLGVSQMAVGVDNVDVAACRERGLLVAHTPGVLTDATADLAFALMLAAARQVPQAHRYVEEGHFQAWEPELFQGAAVGPRPDGSRVVLGLVGYGRIAAAVARRASGFDMEVVAHSRSRERVETDGHEWVGLGELLGRADFVSLHCPLTEETRHLIDRSALWSMKPGAILVNTARGPVVDEVALVEALQSGHLGGAGLDVYEREPELASGLGELENAVLLPHIGSATKPTRDAMAVMAAEAAAALLCGDRPRFVVGDEL